MKLCFERKFKRLSATNFRDVGPIFVLFKKNVLVYTINEGGEIVGLFCAHKTVEQFLQRNEIKNVSCTKIWNRQQNFGT